MEELKERQANARRSAFMLISLLSSSGFLGIAFLMLTALQTRVGVVCTLLVEATMTGTAMFLTRRWAIAERRLRAGRRPSQSL